MAEFPTYEQMAKEVAEKALDEFLYDGKSIREWMKIISEQEPCDNVVSRDAIEQLKKYTDTKKNTDKVEISVLALNRIIKALEKQEPCEDCISRQAVLDTLDTADKFLDEDRPVERYKAMLTEAYEVLPSTNLQEPKTGRWIDMNYYEEWWGKEYKCSECDGRMIGDSEYCPYCGARMIEVSE